MVDAYLVVRVPEYKAQEVRKQLHAINGNGGDILLYSDGMYVMDYFTVNDIYRKQVPAPYQPKHAVAEPVAPTFKLCCCDCGRTAGSNGYCGPSGCYDVPG